MNPERSDETVLSKINPTDPSEKALEHVSSNDDSVRPLVHSALPRDIALNRTAQIGALIEARQEVQDKIEKMFAEDQQTIDFAIENMSQIDRLRLAQFLVDSLYNVFHRGEASSAEASSPVHELMIALERFQDCSSGQ